MPINRANTVRRICGILLSVSVLIAGICLAVACVHIYRSGDQPFSREAVAAAFSPIAVPVYLCLALVIVGFCIDLWLPSEKKRPVPEKHHAMMLQRLHKKIDLTLCSEELRNAVAAEQQGRKRRNRITVGLLGAGSVVFLIYAANGNHFHNSQINASMISAMTVLIPCLIPALIAAIIAQYGNRASIRAEIALLQQADAVAAGQSGAASAGTRRPLRKLQYAILAAALFLLVFGFLTGGTSDVLTKAINICTECVGLG